MARTPIDPTPANPLDTRPRRPSTTASAPAVAGRWTGPGTGSADVATTVEVRRRMAGTPERVYELIADVTRMAEWSPESAGAEWLTGEPGTTGATFRGDNRRPWTRWSTTCTVVEAEPGERFAFTVSADGRLTAVWEFEITRRPGGCEVVERASDRRDRFHKLFGFVTVGLGRRSHRNRRTMRHTLDALARAVER